jgi:CheY-like chemotaxis protein
MYKILVIDDEPGIVEILVDYLAMKGYETSAAANGGEALNLLDRGGIFDLILMDGKMPGVSGIPFLGVLRKKGFNTPAIVLTGSLNTEDITIFNKDLFQEILTKPVHLAELLKLIRKYLPGKKEKSGKRKS